MFSTCSKLTSRAPIPDGMMEQIMQPCGTHRQDYIKQNVSPVSPLQRIVICLGILVQSSYFTRQWILVSTKTLEILLCSSEKSKSGCHPACRLQSYPIMKLAFSPIKIRHFPTICFRIHHCMAFIINFSSCCSSVRSPFLLMMPLLSAISGCFKGSLSLSLSSANDLCFCGNR